MIVATVVNTYLGHLIRMGAKSQVQTRCHANYLTGNGTLIQDFDPVAYQERRTAEGARPATINRECEILKAAAAHWRRTFNEPVPLKYIPKLPERNVRQGFFEEDEWISVAAHLPYWLVQFCEFAYYTGWRKSEIAGLRWEWVNGEIRLPDSKNGRPRVIPLAGTIRTLIDTASANRLTTCPWVFHDPHGRQIKDFRKRWKAACTSAGVPGRLFHDLRRTAARNMLRAGVRMDVAKQITGHVTDSMFHRYAIINTADLASALEKL